MKWRKSSSIRNIFNMDAGTRQPPFLTLGSRGDRMPALSAGFLTSQPFCSSSCGAEVVICPAIAIPQGTAFSEKNGVSEDLRVSGIIFFFREHVLEKQRKKKRGRPDPFETGQPAGQEETRREKEKARHLRQTAWWTRKMGEGVCHYCRRKVGVKNLTMDHVIPLSRGGKSQKGNIVPSCKECNNRKKYFIPVEWEEYLKRLSVPETDPNSPGES
jgi:5-methylcytosine-specific restriction enzyme A